MMASQIFRVVRIIALVMTFFICLIAATRAAGSLQPRTPQLAFISDRMGSWDLFLLDINRTLDARLTFDNTTDNQPSWSPDGQRLAYVASTDTTVDIRILDMASHQTQGTWESLDQIIDQVQANLAKAGCTLSDRDILFVNAQPRWLDDHQLILNPANGRATTTVQMVYDVTTQASHAEMDGLASLPFDPLVSPLGNARLWSFPLEDNVEVWLTDHNRANPRSLSNHPARDFEPSWSSEGDWIAFTSQRDGNMEIYVVRADGSGLRRVTFNPGSDRVPIWRPSPSTQNAQDGFIRQ
jgi:WD40 repeat protein